MLNHNLKDKLLPEDILQLNKLYAAIELSENNSFFSIIGLDDEELFQNIIDDINIKSNISISVLNSQSNNVFQEIVDKGLVDSFLGVNLINQKDDEIIRNLLFFRDFISDYKLKVIIFVNTSTYNDILKNAIDLYNVSTFAYLFFTYKVENNLTLERNDINNLISEYRNKKIGLSKKQKVAYLKEIGIQQSTNGYIYEAFKSFNQALTIAYKVKVHENIIDLKMRLAFLYRYLNKYSSAVVYLKECIEYFKKKNLLTNLEVAYETIILCYIKMKEFDKANNINNEIMKFFNKTNNKSYLLNNYRFKLLTCYEQKSISHYEKYWNLSNDLATQLNNQHILGDLYQFKAVSFISENKYLEALTFVEKALKIYHKRKNYFMINGMYTKLASCYLGLHDYDKSIIYCKRAYAYFKENKIMIDLLEVLQVYANNLVALNREDEALEKQFELNKIAKDQKRKDYLLDSYLNISQIYLLRKDYSKAIDNVNKAQSSIVDTIGKFLIYTRFCDIYSDMKDLRNANKYYELSLKYLDKDSLSNLAYLTEISGEIAMNCKDENDFALKEFLTALTLAKKDNNEYRIFSLEENLAKVYTKLNEPMLSKRFYMELINKLEVINPNGSKILTLKESLSKL